MLSIIGVVILLILSSALIPNLQYCYWIFCLTGTVVTDEKCFLGILCQCIFTVHHSPRTVSPRLQWLIFDNLIYYITVAIFYITSANEYFSEFLTNNSLNANQIDFVQTIINHIVANGGLFDNSILQKHPFTKHGSVVELFDGKVEIIHGMMGKVRELNDRLVI